MTDSITDCITECESLCNEYECIPIKEQNYE